MNSIEKSREAWKQATGVAIPMAHILRTRFANRWVRVYNLPHGEPFPTTSEEWSTALSRNREVIAYMIKNFGVSTTLEVLVPYPRTGSPSGFVDILEGGLAPKFWGTVEDEGQQIEIWLGSIRPTETWTLNSLLERVINEEVDGLVVGPQDYSWIYAPYAAGLDVALPRADDVASFKAHFKDWVSPRTDGL